MEFESDTIKKVYVHSKDGKRKSEIYVISLVEHKSSVDYDVAMQLLRYMSVIWHDYKVTQEKEQKDAAAGRISNIHLLFRLYIMRVQENGQRIFISKTE